MQGPMRIVVLTSGPLKPVNRVFFERLASDPLLHLAGIVVDEYQRPRRSLPALIARGLRQDGWGWLSWKLATTAERLIQRGALALWDLVHPKVWKEESYEAFQLRTGISTYPVADIHGEGSRGLIRSLRPHLGAIVGTRILKDTVLTIPDLGTLDIHKRKVPEYRGGGPIGYWEVLAGERSIGVTIHVAVSQVDAGPVLGQIEIPMEECDTLESLRIKADIAGARLYHDVIRDLALGRRAGTPQDLTWARTYKIPSQPKVWRLERCLMRRRAQRMASLRQQRSWLVRARSVAGYVAVLPVLLAIRNFLLRRRQAPICLLYYHVVANRPVNHMCLPLDIFVQQVEFLRRYVDLLSLEDAAQHLRSGANERLAAVLTFDDGYSDNAWAIEYLRYFDIPAAFFVSAGHVRDGSPFEHDRALGFAEAPPMRTDEVRELIMAGFPVGSHGMYHEDFAVLDGQASERVLRESGELVATMTGQRPSHFSFPIGQPGQQVTAATLARAQQHYEYVYSAYGGYNLPADRRHLFRILNPTDLLALAMIIDGYTGLRRCLCGDAWGWRTWRRG